jgi:hypothetical protein
MTGHANAEAIAAVKDRALAASDPLTFRACLAHRVLARLISATRQDAHIAPVAQHARALLSPRRLKQRTGHTTTNQQQWRTGPRCLSRTCSSQLWIEPPGLLQGQQTQEAAA